MLDPERSMVATPHPLTDEPSPRSETEAERTARLARERALLEEAREDVRAGRVIAADDVDAWLDRFTSGELLPLPEAPAVSPIG